MNVPRKKRGFEYFHQGNNYAQIRKFFKEFYGIDITKMKEEDSDSLFETIQKIVLGENNIGNQKFTEYLLMKEIYENSPNEENKRRFIKAIENFNNYAEHTMSSIRQSLKNGNLGNFGKDTNVSEELNYLFIQKAASQNGKTQIELHLRNTTQLLKQELNHLSLREGSISYAVNTSKKIRFNDNGIELTESQKNLKDKLADLQFRLNEELGRDNSIIDQIANVIYATKTNDNGEVKNKKVGYGRAFDILLSGNKLERFLGTDEDRKNLIDELRNQFFNPNGEAIIDNIKAAMGENIAGLLIGDTQLGDQQIQIKTQGFGTNTIGFSRTAMLENFYYVFSNPELLTNVLRDDPQLKINTSPITMENFVVDTLNNNPELYSNFIQEYYGTETQLVDAAFSQLGLSQSTGDSGNMWLFEENIDLRMQ